MRVTFDRGDFEDRPWRWALSNSEIVNAEGRANINLQVDDPRDLIQLLEEPKNDNTASKP